MYNIYTEKHKDKYCIDSYNTLEEAKKALANYLFTDPKNDYWIVIEK